jgi:acyl-CoA thioesterase FadM
MPLPYAARGRRNRAAAKFAPRKLPAGSIWVMHLLLRTLFHLFRSRSRPKLGIWDTSSLPLRVLPTDVDMALHINNGMYFSLMDLGRFDLMVRSGMWAVMRRNGWNPIVGGETISFRKPLNLGAKYTIESKIIGFDERAIFFEQRMVSGGEIYARAYICARLVSQQGPVSNEEIFAETGAPPAELVLPEWIHEWRLNNSLPSTRRPAPHAWLK